jgi:hypothetical protein
MSDIKRLAKAVLDTCFYVDYYEYRDRPFIKFCNHCSGNVDPEEELTDEDHAANCEVLLAKKILNEQN